MFLPSLGEEDREAFRSKAETITYRTGDTVVREGLRTGHVHVIESGGIKVVSASRGGYGAVLALLGPGDLVGEMATIDGSPHFATATCIVPVRAHRVRECDFQALLSTRPGITHVVLGIMTSRLRNADHQRVERADRPVRARLAALLIDLVARHGVPADAGISISLPISQSDMAGLITASREAVIKALSEWRAIGLVSTSRQRVVVHSLNTLRAIADA